MQEHIGKKAYYLDFPSLKPIPGKIVDFIPWSRNLSKTPNCFVMKPFDRKQNIVDHVNSFIVQVPSKEIHPYWKRVLRRMFPDDRIHIGVCYGDSATNTETTLFNKQNGLKLKYEIRELTTGSVRTITGRNFPVENNQQLEQSFTEYKIGNLNIPVYRDDFQ